MVKAEQIERDGTKHGAVRTFTAAHWRRMREIYGKRLRWEIIGEAPEEVAPEEVEYPEYETKREPVSETIQDSEHSEDEITFSQNDFDSYDFDGNTKSEIVKDFCMDEEDKKLNRIALIEKVNNKVLNKE